jgi:arsenate reductase-like glutaredoxin family protein
MVKSVQIFGTRKSQPTRAAERFFKERGVPIHFVDLQVKPMAPGEIRRFVEKYTLRGLFDAEGKAYAAAGLKYINHTDAGLLQKIEAAPDLLKLPLVRGANKLALGADQEAWKVILDALQQT